MVELLGGRAVGAVETVTANAVTVLVDPDAPQATALNTSALTPFPRINGYLLVPNESGAMVGIVTSVRIERAAYPKRRGMQDFGLIDLPFPGRLLSLTPLGTLVAKPAEQGDAELRFEVRRGVDVFPSVGDSVLLPTPAQLRAIVEGEGAEEERRVWLGTCPTATGSRVFVDPDKLFGRHLAVLGNTGAGKSCTVAGLIRWSLAAAEAERERRAQEDATTWGAKPRTPNARFIVLDPNGEYATAFTGLSLRLFQVGAGRPDAVQLKVPAWLWNGEEWAAFTGAAPGVQRPILFDALRRLRAGGGAPGAAETHIRGRVKRYRARLRIAISSGEHQARGRREGLATVLLNIVQDFAEVAGNVSAEVAVLIRNVVDVAQRTEATARSNRNDGGYWHNDFSEKTLGDVEEALKALAEAVGVGDDEGGVAEDAPSFFAIGDLPDFVEALAADAPGRDASQFIDSLNLRIRGLFAAGALSAVADPGVEPSVTLAEWLTAYIGADQAMDGVLTILDLSLVPSDALHVIVAVLARMIFEAVQRHRRRMRSELPTVLVLDEAHTFIHKDMTGESAPPAGRLCCRTFERIAREGRKFGLGLVLASQRPSEVSPTVLSQCNTFLLHRIVNDRDQELVKSLVPDGLGDMLRELPSLPSRRAILLGWAAPAPLLVEVRELDEAHRPHSPDPAFWKVWTGAQACRVDWEAVAKAWQKGAVTGEPAKSAADGTEVPEAT